jgi:hypothetical protein
MKWIAVVLLALLLVFGLAGCGLYLSELFDPDTYRAAPEEVFDASVWEAAAPCGSLQELEGAAGVDIVLPESVGGYERRGFTVYGDEAAGQGLVAAVEYAGSGGVLMYYSSRDPLLYEWVPEDLPEGDIVSAYDMFFGGYWYEGEPIEVSMHYVVMDYGEKVDEFGGIYDDWEHFVRQAMWQTGDVYRMLVWSPGVPAETVGSEVTGVFLAYMEPEKWDPSRIEGSVLEFDLRENPTTGNWWGCRVEGSALRLVGDEYSPDEVEDGVAGAGGWHYWRIEAVEPGEATVLLKLGNGDPDDAAWYETDVPWVLHYTVAEDLSISFAGLE